MIYFISDTHFGHKGSLTWPKERPFTTVEEMNETIINNWNNTVSKEDTVYFLGDFAYKTSKSIIRKILNRLNGNIIFIKGNHDGVVLKVNETLKRFPPVYDILKIEYEGIDFILCHYPLYSWQNKKRGSIHLHGHTHENNPDIKGNIFNVSCENINYTPISIVDIIKKFK
jgi:calcineurin-like phosphoesterase family protein